jgi:hypothetical protein
MEDKGLAVSREAADGGDGPREAPDDGCGDRASSAPVSGMHSVSDEAARTRLMVEITRLIHEPETPEPTRSAGLTLIGWLARRRAHETPHAIGIVEARESERRVKAARPKTR